MIDIDIRNGGIELPSGDELDAMFRQGVADVGNYWHDHYLEEHFGPGAAQRYGYTPRKGEPGSGRPFKGSYAARKSRKKGNIGPLKWSGRSYQDAKQRRFRVTAEGNGIAIRILLPTSFNRRNPKSQIHMNQEIREVRIDELETLVAVFVNSVRRQIAAKMGQQL